MSMICFNAPLLSVDRMFHADFEDGSLDQLALLELPLWATALAKTLAHWATLGLPLLIAAPLLAIAFGMPMSGLPVLLAALALGGPLLSLIGAIGAALTLGARRSGAILPLLVLPLYVPILVFGAAAVEAALLGLSAQSALTMLGGLALAGLVLAPWAAAAALRHALE